MENASKALIMAASVLLGIMLLSVLVYAFNQFSVFGTDYQQQLSEQEIQKINNKFLIYDKREDLIVQDLVNIAYLAKGENERNDVSSNANTNFYITVDAYDALDNNIMQDKRPICRTFEKASDEIYYYAMINIGRADYQARPSANIKETLRFTCEVEDPNLNITKRVKKITLTQTSFERWQQISPI